jgi:hypothetical protein
MSMATESFSNDGKVNLVVMVGVGVLEPDPGVGIRLTYATSQERFEAKQWDIQEFAIPSRIATEFLDLLQKAVRQLPTTH